MQNIRHYGPLKTSAKRANAAKRLSPPVNILASPAAPPVSQLAALNVARVSFGPFPWRKAMAELTQAAAEHYPARA